MSKPYDSAPASDPTWADPRPFPIPAKPRAASIQCAVGNHASCPGEGPEHRRGAVVVAEAWCCVCPQGCHDPEGT